MTWLQLKDQNYNIIVGILYSGNSFRPTSLVAWDYKNTEGHLSIDKVLFFDGVFRFWFSLIRVLVLLY